MSWVKRGVGALASPPLAYPVTIALLALLASGTGLGNGFVYDDGPVIHRNPRVHTLARWWEAFAQPYWPPNWGDTNYRPLTILSFATQWALGDGSPVVFHVVSVALYVATSVLVFSLARRVLPARAAWFAAALFAVHPVHVEAVANVVGQSELVVAMCSVLAVVAYLRMRETSRPPDMRATASIAALYAIACLSKESGFLLPGLLIAAEVTVVATQLEPARRPVRFRVAELWPFYTTCGAVGGAYLLARYAVLGGFGDDPNLVISLLGHQARLLTMLGVVREWARLLLWPARLAADYSPPDIEVILEPGAAIVPGVVILLGVVAVAAVAWRTRRRAATFGLLWLAVAIFPVSNLFVRSGVIVAERTLFLPSVGAMLAVGAAVAWAIARLEHLEPARLRFATATLTLLIVLGAVRSADRQLVWRDNDTFLRQIVKDAPSSYRAHYMHGMWLFDQGRRAEGERHARMAMAMFPYDAGPPTDLGEQYRKAGLCEPARVLYKRAIALGSSRPTPRLGLVACLLRDAEFVEAAEQARVGASWSWPQAKEFRRLLAIADSAIAATSGVRQSGAPLRAPPK